MRSVMETIAVEGLNLKVIMVYEADVVARVDEDNIS